MADTTLSGSGQKSPGQAGAGSLAKSGPAAVSDITESARGALDDVKEMGSDLITSARDGANALFEEQRNRAADEIASLGDMLHKSVKSLDQGGTTVVGRYADQAAGQINDFADALRERSFGEVAADVEGFARQWPIAFIASAMAVGFVATRFLMSSASRPAAPSSGTATKPMNKVSADKIEPAKGNRIATNGQATAKPTPGGTSSTATSSPGTSSNGISSNGAV